MSESLAQLKSHLARIQRLTEVNNLLDWDQQTYMPHGATEARAEQCAVLSELTHELATSDATGDLLARCESEFKGQDPDSDEARLLAVARRDYDREAKLPTALVAELARHSALSQEIWMRARERSDFEAFAPALEKMYDLKRQQAEHLSYREHPYDALIDEYEPGTTQADVAAMFADMKPALIALTQQIGSAPEPVDASCLHAANFALEAQRALTLRIVAALGYDLNRGRQDEAVHPFCSNFSRDDVRITTHFDPAFLGQALYASLHEAGHAMYEQGSPDRFEGSPLAGGASLGVHESQSRLWENLVGRSHAFSRWIFPQLQETWPNAFGPSSAEVFYRAVNKVEPSLIRIEADEVTYNLHVLLRFELECALLSGELAVNDLPDAWDAKMQEYLGVTPPTDAQGCLQDVHWSTGLVGYFPTYSIGNLLSGQLWHALRAVLPDVDEQIARGEFAPLLDWLREHVHVYGRKYLPRELAVKATGEPLTSHYYLDYLRAKYSDIYGI